MVEPILSTKERNKLAYEIVAKLSDFTDYGIQGRREFVRASGLEKFLSGIAWGGSDRTVAGILIDKLNSHGFLPERPKYHAVGALIAYLLEHPEVSITDKKYIAGLVVRFHLIRDPNYIEELQNNYDISDASCVQLEPNRTLEVAELTRQVQQPTFVPEVQDEDALERALSSEDNFLEIYQLLGAIYSAQAVGRIQLSLKEPLGTGWLIGPDLLLTNHHVLPNLDLVDAAQVRFGYRKDSLGVEIEGLTVNLDPDCYYGSPGEELDYALVRLKEQPLAHMSPGGDISGLTLYDLIRRGHHRGYLLFVPDKKIANLQRVNIIQYPEKDYPYQKVVLTQNYVTHDMYPTRVHYTANTKKGSSGSPVFNLMWQVIALHHSGTPFPPIPGRENSNEGIPMMAIRKDFDVKRTKQGRPLSSLLP